MERDMAILKLLAESEKPLNKYRIWLQFQSKEMGTEPTFLTAIDQLEECGIIFAIQTNEKARGGTPSKQYDLTLRGLMWLLGGIYPLEPNKLVLSSSTIPYLLKKYHSFVPEIFDHWDRYNANNIEDLAEKCLAHVAERWYDASAYIEHKTELKRWRKKDREEGKTEPNFRPRFIHNFYEHVAFLRSEDAAKWLRAMKSDSELCGPYIAYLENEKKHYLELAAGIDGLIQHIKSTGQKS